MARRNGTPPQPTGELVEQAHGGRIWRGTPKNIVPGPGRPPSIIRQRLRESFDKRIAFLEKVADGKVKEATVAERLKAAEILAKYGLGTTVTETDTEGRDITVRVVRVPMGIHDDN